MSHSSVGQNLDRTQWGQLVTVTHSVRSQLRWLKGRWKRWRAAEASLSLPLDFLSLNLFLLHEATEVLASGLCSSAGSQEDQTKASRLLIPRPKTGSASLLSPRSRKQITSLKSWVSGNLWPFKSTTRWIMGTLKFGGIKNNGDIWNLGALKNHEAHHSNIVSRITHLSFEEMLEPPDLR